MPTNSPTPDPIFFGEFRHALDEKSRVTIPSRWRRGDSDEFFIVPNPSQQCLTAMPPEVFKRIGDEAGKHIAVSQQEHRIFMRNFYSRAQLCATDKQGRLLLPVAHCDQAGLKPKSDAMLTGGSDRFEIWSPEAWAKFQEAATQTYEHVAGVVGL
jgi:transcriptional regulator MraZ